MTSPGDGPVGSDPTGPFAPDFSAPVPHGVFPAVPGVRLDAQIGRGGYATVYRARQLSVDRDVAVKVDDRRLLQDRDKRRFTREIVAAGSVSAHPHIVTVYDGGTTADDHPYLVMELYPGGSYSDRMKQTGPVAPAEVLAVGVGISDALAIAHADGILHRDVKPGNILISRYGSPALADFGLAALPRAAEGFSVTMESLTPSYAPPEAFSGAEPTAAMDVYSLGATLYALLLGRAPRSDKSGTAPPLARLLFMLNEPLPYPDVEGAEALMPAIWRATMFEPSQRYRSAADMHDALTAVRVGASPGLFRPVPPTETPSGSTATGPTSTGPTATGSTQPGPPTGPSISGPTRPGQTPQGQTFSGLPIASGRHSASSPDETSDSGPFALFGRPDPSGTPTGSQVRRSGLPPGKARERSGRQWWWVGAAAAVVALVVTGLIVFGNRSTTGGVAQAGVSLGSTAARSSGSLETDLGRLNRTAASKTSAPQTTGPQTTGPQTTGPSTTPSKKSSVTPVVVTTPATSSPGSTTETSTSTPTSIIGVVTAPKVGSCWSGLVNISGQVTSEEVACDQPHYWEAYATGVLSPQTATPYAKDAYKDPVVLRTCTQDALKAYLGPQSHGTFNIDLLPPSAVDFSAGHKGFWCVASVPGAGEVTGSLKNGT
ncbi:serine/threonine protein kinase [Nakamurella sp. UYEF19]|uniref:serine/threonine-protein kinase n=1 Tax=Nakamurella sp. UYEF19 TaxID=1756392 RepID=UPI003397C85A